VDGLELVFLPHPPSLVSFSEFYSRNMYTLLYLNVLSVIIKDTGLELVKKKFWCHFHPFANIWFVLPYLINEGDIRELVIYH